MNKKKKEKEISAVIKLPRKKEIFFQGRKSTLEKIFPGAKLSKEK